MPVTTYLKTNSGGVSMANITQNYRTIAIEMDKMLIEKFKIMALKDRKYIAYSNLCTRIKTGWELCECLFDGNYLENDVLVKTYFGAINEYILTLLDFLKYTEELAKENNRTHVLGMDNMLYDARIAINKAINLYSAYMINEIKYVKLAIKKINKQEIRKEKTTYEKERKEFLKVVKKYFRVIDVFSIWYYKDNGKEKFKELSRCI